MTYIEFEVGKEVYKLRLTTRSLIGLEQDLGYSPLQLFGVGDNPKTPSIEDMLKVFKASLKAYHEELKEDDVYAIFDTWIEDGHITSEFLAIIIKVYKASGLLRDNSKN